MNHQPKIRTPAFCLIEKPAPRACAASTSSGSPPAGSQQASAGPYNAWVSTSQFQASAVEDQPDCAQRLHDHGGQSEPKIGANHAVSYWRRVRD
jgi:hypothetical protein